MKATRLLISCLIACFALLLAQPASALDVNVEVSSFRVDLELDYGPENLLDGNTDTAWVGGGVGPGVGQWVNLVFPIPIRVQKLGIFNGHQAEGRFKEFRRIRSGRIVYPDGTEIGFWLRDESGEQVIKCSGKPTKSLRIVIDEVFPKGEMLSNIKLAVSEIKIYMSLMGAPGSAGATAEPEPAYTPAPPPVEPDKEVPREIVDLLKLFYVMQTSLADDYATLFAEDVRDRNDFRFEVFKSVQRQRGTYDILRTAEVDTDGLGFELLRMEGAWAEVRVFGAYRVKVADLDQNLEEDSVFVLSRESDGWKIVELDGEEDLF